MNFLSQPNRMAATANRQDRKGFYSVKFTDTEPKTVAMLAESEYNLKCFYMLSLYNIVI